MEKRAVIYARYSCDKQSEQSIEGQIHVINDFSVRNGYTIVSSYIDRAKSAKTANRPQFLQMISDSTKGLFDFVLVRTSQIRIGRTAAFSRTCAVTHTDKT